MTLPIVPVPTRYDTNTGTGYRLDTMGIRQGIFEYSFAVVSLEKTEFFYVITFSSKERKECYKKEREEDEKTERVWLQLQMKKKRFPCSNRRCLSLSLSLGLSLPKQGKKPSDPF